MYRDFTGKLNGVTLDEIKGDFFEKYYDQTHLADDRVKDVKRFLKEQSNGFFEDYCSSLFLAKTPSDQNMSDDDSVCHFMEVLATYVILGNSDKYPFDRDLFARNL